MNHYDTHLGNVVTVGRIINGLRAAGFLTVRHLFDNTWGNYTAIPRLGPRSQQQLDEILLMAGFDVGEYLLELPEEHPVTPAVVNLIFPFDVVIRRKSDLRMLTREQVMRIAPIHFLSFQRVLAVLHSMGIDMMSNDDAHVLSMYKFPARIRNTLYEAGIYTASELLRMSEGGLAALFGENSGSLLTVLEWRDKTLGSPKPKVPSKLSETLLLTDSQIEELHGSALLSPIPWQRLEHHERMSVANWLDTKARELGYTKKRGWLFDPCDRGGYDGLWGTLVDMQEVRVGDSIVYKLAASRARGVGTVTELHPLPGANYWTSSFSVECQSRDGADPFQIQVGIGDFKGKDLNPTLFLRGLLGIAYIEQQNPSRVADLTRLIRGAARFYHSNVSWMIQDRYAGCLEELAAHPERVPSIEECTDTARGLHRYALDLTVDYKNLSALCICQEILIALFPNMQDERITRRHPEMVRPYLELCERQMQIRLKSGYTATFSIVEMGYSTRLQRSSIEPGLIRAERGVLDSAVYREWKDMHTPLRQVPCRVIHYRYGRGEVRPAEEDLMNVVRQTGPRIFELPAFERIGDMIIQMLI